MSIIRISKEFTFEMAHALHGYDGKCAGLHGHSYHLTVTVRGEVRNDMQPDGMVMDFGELKRIVNESVLSDFDHALVLNEKDPLCQHVLHSPTKLVTTAYQPTCENLLIDFANRIKPALKPAVKLFSLRLRETGTCYGEWFSSDHE